MNHSIRALLLLTLPAFVAGCAGLQEAMNLSQVDANLRGVQVDALSLDAATLLFDVEVDNPYSVPIPLVNLDYALASGGKRFASGDAELTGIVPAQGSRVVSIPATVAYADMLSILSQVKPGSILPYTAQLGLSVDTPLGDALRVPLERESELPIPAVPKVKIASIDWEELTAQQARGVIKLRAENPNAFPLDLSTLDYAFNLGGKEVAAARVAKDINLAANGGSDVIEIPLSFTPMQLGFGFFNMLTGREAGYDFTGMFDVTTPYGPLQLPVKEAGEALMRK